MPFHINCSYQFHFISFILSISFYQFHLSISFINFIINFISSILSQTFILYTLELISSKYSKLSLLWLEIPNFAVVCILQSNTNTCYKNSWDVSHPSHVVPTPLCIKILHGTAWCMCYFTALNQHLLFTLEKKALVFCGGLGLVHTLLHAFLSNT